MPTDNQGHLSGTGQSGSARARIIAAFNAMILQRQRGPFRVGDIVRQARVARSTFYDHFPSESALQLTALNAPFADIADALAGCGDASKLVGWLAHFWDYRQQTRPILAGRDRARIERMLVDLLVIRLRSNEAVDPTKAQICALQISAATLAALHSWVSGGFCMPAAVLAEQLAQTAKAIRASAGFA